MKRILVPADFSPQSIEAFKFALAIAAVNKAEVHVLHAIPFPPYFVGSFDVQIHTYNPSTLYEFDRAAARNFEKIRKQYASKKKGIRFTVEHGQVTPVVLQYIKARRIDLVIMGTQGSTGLKEFVIGSNTEKIVHFSKVPVLVVRKAPEISSLKNIVVPTNLDPILRGVIKKIKELQLFFKARLHLLFVNTPAWFIPDHESTRALDQFAKKNKLKNYTINVRSDVNESEGVAHFAHEKRGGLIAMATHGRKGLSHLLGGSIAEKIVNHFDYPIWTFVAKK